MSAPKNICFDGKVVLVTGASSGIGATTAIEFARHGASVAITGRNLDNLKKTGEKCAAFGKKPHLIQADLMKDSDIENIMASTIKHYGKLDVLVNNAGVAAMGGVENGTLEDFDRVFQTNVRAVFKLTKLAVPHLIKTKGSVVNVSSVAGVRAFEACVAYSMSKAALDHFTRCTALELAPHQVRVNGVAPGLVMTELQNRMGLPQEVSQQFIEHHKKIHPLGRAGETEEIADLIMFLASDKTKFITATTVSIDGGYHAAVPK